MGTVSSKRPNKHYTNSYNEMFKDFNDDYRMHLMHCIFKEIWGANFQAPVDAALRQGARVLDVGCGAGTWVNDMASDYRSSRFTGIDILPSFPTVAKPFNVDFVHANILKGLPFEDNTFDYIHCRFMIFDFMECQWDFIYKEICRVLKPGGRIEVVESELGFISEGPYTRGVVEAIYREMRYKGINPFIISRHEHLLRSTANLHHVSHQQKNYKIDSNSGKISEQLSLNLREMFKGFLLNFDGNVGIDIGLTNGRRPMSLGNARNNEDHNNHAESGNIKHKRKSGFNGDRSYNRENGISNKENNKFNRGTTHETSKTVKRESTRSLNIKSSKKKNEKRDEIRKESIVEMIVERISEEFDIYQSMILMHRFWAQKGSVTNTRKR